MSELLLKLKKIFSKIYDFFNLPNQLRDLQDLIIFHQTKLLQLNHSNPLNKFGKKCFSQADEDGITLEILRRINKTDKGVYAEFGVGNGTENNTLILAALGWAGFWVGGEDLTFNVDRKTNPNFSYQKEWITLENIVRFTKKGLSDIGTDDLDVISLDLDGNDIYLVEELLKNKFRPKIFIVEYNAKFPPPVNFKIPYDPEHSWKNDDYFGASLSSFNNVFNKFNYKLICCNSQTGANAFFIDSCYSEFFTDVPDDINQIYAEPRYHLYNRYGHKQSTRTIKSIFKG